MKSKQLVGQHDPLTHFELSTIPIFQVNNLSLRHNYLIQHGHATGAWQMKPSCEMFILWTQIGLSQGVLYVVQGLQGFHQVEKLPHNDQRVTVKREVQSSDKA